MSYCGSFSTLLDHPVRCLLVDDEPLFGECGEAKLIVSVIFGSSAVFKWKGQSCPDDEGHLCWFWPW